MSARYKKWKDIFLVWLTLLVVLERNGDVGDVDEDVGGGCDVDVGVVVFQSILYLCAATLPSGRRRRIILMIIIKIIIIFIIFKIIFCVCVQRPCQAGGGGGSRWRRWRRRS